MRSKPSEMVERGRERTGFYGTSVGSRYGAFLLIGPCGQTLRIIASDSEEDVPWEHVSVSLRKRTPNWTEMSWVKSLFWEPQETVMQLHPAESEYVNNHPFTLHMWKPTGEAIPLPPSIAVGIKGVQPEEFRANMHDTEWLQRRMEEQL